MLINTMYVRCLLALTLIVTSSQAFARLEVCNHTDLVVMVAVAYDVSEQRRVSEGWWRIYPGFCEVPVDVSFLEGSYYLHATSDLASTMPGDAFSWGDDKSLCVSFNADFKLTDADFCSSNNTEINFNEVGKNWRNLNMVELYHQDRRYLNQFRTKMAGVQRMLSILGHDVGDIDGVAGQKTVDALNQIAADNSVFAFDFKQIFPLLERIIIDKQNQPH